MLSASCTAVGRRLVEMAMALAIGSSLGGLIDCLQCYLDSGQLDMGPAVVVRGPSAACWRPLRSGSPAVPLRGNNGSWARLAEPQARVTLCRDLAYRAGSAVYRHADSFEEKP